MGRKGKRGYKGVIWQSVIAMPLVTLLMSFVCAKLIVNDMIQETNVEMCAYIIAGVVAFLLSLYCAIRMPQKKAMWGIGAAVCYALMLLLGNLLFFGLGYGEVLSIVLSVLTGGVPGALVGALKRRKYA